MITIRKSSVFPHDNRTRIQNVIDIDGDKRILWFDVDPEYGQYLCHERSDAYVIGVLNYAMRHGHDITCEMPVGEELHYQISTTLIPSLANSSKSLYHTKLIADIDCNRMPNEGAVGTGISCGIDSLHALACHTKSDYTSLNITHLVLNNVGSHGVGEESEILRQGRESNAKEIAEELELRLVLTNSNFAEVIEQSHYLTHTYSSCFAIYMLAKLWGFYYYASSGYDYTHFNLIDSEKQAPGHYELLSLSCFSSRDLKIYSEGGERSRFEKTRIITNYPPSTSYLNVCLSQMSNCGNCAKCRRTLVALDAIKKIDDFSDVFDVEYYKSHKSEYMSWLCRQKMMQDPFVAEAYSKLSTDIKFYNRLVAFLSYTLLLLRRFVLRKSVHSA